MADWQNKLENTIESLENQSGLLSSAVELYENINNLKNDLVDSYLGFEESKTAFNEVSKNLKTDLINFKNQITNIENTSADELEKFNNVNEIFQEKLIVNIIELETLINSKMKTISSDINSKIETLTTNTQKEISSIEKSNSLFQEKIITDINKLDNLLNLKYETISSDINAKIDEINTAVQQNIAQLDDGIQNKIQELYKDNKNFQKELDASIVSRLEKHKSDIQVELRNEGSQIQRGFETTLNSNFSSMESKLKELFNEQSKQLNLLKILMFIAIGVGIGIGIGLFLK